MLTKREQYIKDSFFSDLPEDSANNIVKKISSIGDSIGFVGGSINQDQNKADKRKHKYDVWISKEVKKDNELINRITDFRLIVDWASETRADIFRYDFKSAYQAQTDWHDEMRRKLQIQKMDMPDVEEDRIVFKFSDNNHFLYLLTPKDLKHEGAVMGHCVAGSHYKNKINNRKSLILSLRDSKNMPHVTIEIDVDRRQVVQQYGKGNKKPVDKYLDMIIEFALFVCGYKDLKNKEVLSFLNLDF